MHIYSLDFEFSHSLTNTSRPIKNCRRNGAFLVIMDKSYGPSVFYDSTGIDGHRYIAAVEQAFTIVMRAKTDVAREAENRAIHGNGEPTVLRPSRITSKIHRYCAQAPDGFTEPLSNSIFLENPWPGLMAMLASSPSVVLDLSFRLTSTTGWLTSQPASPRISATVIVSLDHGYSVPPMLMKYFGPLPSVLPLSAIVYSFRTWFDG